jgi:hypothetical protein
MIAFLLSFLVLGIAFCFGDKHVVNYRDTCPTPDYPLHCCRGKLRTEGFQAEEHMHYTIHTQAELRTKFYLTELLVSLSRSSTPNLGCFLGFSGDSLMSDTFMAMICQLKMMGYSHNCIPSCVGGPKYYAGETFVPCNVTKTDKRTVELRLNSSNSSMHMHSICPKVMSICPYITYHHTCIRHTVHVDVYIYCDCEFIYYTPSTTVCWYVVQSPLNHVHHIHIRHLGNR